MERVRLIAKDGEIYTNGETYGTDITLAEGLDGKDYYLITYEAYKKITAVKDAPNNYDE